MSKEKTTRLHQDLKKLRSQVDSIKQEAVNNLISLRKKIAELENQKKQIPSRQNDIEAQLKEYDEMIQSTLGIIDDINTHSSLYSATQKKLEIALDNPEDFAGPTIR